MVNEKQGANPGPKQINGGRRNHGTSTSSKTEAIKDSQEDRERYVNKSALNDE